MDSPKFSEVPFWALSARILATVMAMACSVIIARLYGAEMMGVVALINSFMTLASIFTVLGTDISMLRLIPEHLTKYSAISALRVYRKSQYFVAGVSIVTGGLLFIASHFIADTVFSKPQMSFYFALAAGFVLAKSLMVLNTQSIRALKLIRTFAPFCRLVPRSLCLYYS